MTNYVKIKRHVLTNTGYQLLSQWTSTNSVELDNGDSVEEAIEYLKEII